MPLWDKTYDNVTNKCPTKCPVFYLYYEFIIWKCDSHIYLFRFDQRGLHTNVSLFVILFKTFVIFFFNIEKSCKLFLESCTFIMSQNINVFSNVAFLYNLMSCAVLISSFNFILWLWINFILVKRSRTCSLDWKGCRPLIRGGI